MEEESDLSKEIKEYTITELTQLKKMTEDVKEHWLKMLKEISDDKKGLKMAVELSIKQAETDLELIEKELAGRN
jgi:hypothetical protein